MLLKALFIILLSGTGQARKATPGITASPEAGQCLVGHFEGFHSDLLNDQVAKQLNQVLSRLSGSVNTLALAKKNPRQQYLFNEYKKNLALLSGNKTTEVSYSTELYSLPPELMQALE